MLSLMISLRWSWYIFHTTYAVLACFLDFTWVYLSMVQLLLELLIVIIMALVVVEYIVSIFHFYFTYACLQRDIFSGTSFKVLYLDSHTMNVRDEHPSTRGIYCDKILELFANLDINLPLTLWMNIDCTY